MHRPAEVDIPRIPVLRGHPRVRCAPPTPIQAGRRVSGISPFGGSGLVQAHTPTPHKVSGLGILACERGQQSHRLLGWSGVGVAG